MRVVDTSALVTLIAGRDQATRDELGTTLTGHELHVPALAEILDCPLVTCDAKLRAGGHRAEVLIVGARL